MAKILKIGLDGRFYRKETGGIGRYSRQLVKNLLQIDHQNQYFLFLTDEDFAQCDLEAENLSKIKVNIGHYSLSEQIKLPSILKKYNLDLMHFLNFNHPLWYKGKFIVTIHDLTMIFHPSLRRQKSKFYRVAFKKVLKNAILKSEKIIVVSNAVKKDILNFYKTDENRIKVVYEGVAENFKPVSSDKVEKVKQKFSISKPFILFVSQWRPHKGLIEAIKAFGILKNNYKKDFQFIIIGQPNPDFPQIQQTIDKSPYKSDIILPGFVCEEDLPSFYSGAAVFVFPSYYEGFGLPPLEAMATGLPVASSNRSCMPEILGTAANYFNPDNPADIAQKIADIIDNEILRRNLIARGFKQVKKYSFNNMARETFNIYNSILK